MPKKAGIVVMVAGAVLIFAALSLFLYNRYEDAQAGQAAENLLQDVQSAIEENLSMPPESEELPSSEPIDPSMTVIEIDGYGYIGYLSIPDLSLELPIMDQWDYTRMKIAPCRHFGSTKTDDLVIAGHNYASHFGSLRTLKPGSRVDFTDMDGEVHTYEVIYLDTLAPTDVVAVQDSGYDLVLYTCTPGGKTRETVFCNRVLEAQDEDKITEKK